MSKSYHVYILTNKGNHVLYTGVTSDLRRRVSQHREGKGGVFSSRYNLAKLVYFEEFHSAHAAIAREKQLKGGSRQRKIELIESVNPDWEDLFEALLE